MKKDIASTMLKEGGMTAAFIARMTLLSEESVRKLVKSLDVAVV